MRCLNPDKLANYDCSSLFKAVLSHLVDCKVLDGSECDECLTQFKMFNNDESIISEMCGFKRDEHRVDTLLYETMGTKDKFAKLWDVVKKLLILSHGQATVERGFSVNKDVSTENLSEHNLVAKRTIKDYLNHIGGIDKLVIEKPLLDYCHGARQQYLRYLDQKKDNEAEKKKGEKRKCAEEELHELKQKIKKAKQSVDYLVSEADKCAARAEEKQVLKILMLSNNHRKRANEKKLEVEKCEKKLKAKEVDFLNI